jgi:RNA polymerase sigma-70 factor (ECF subfamily)
MLHLGVKKMLQLLPKKQIPSYEEFYEDNYTRVLHYVKNKINAVEDAEDLTSEVFVYCYNHYSDYDPDKSSITTWLYLIVNSRIKNYYRDHVSFADYDAVCNTIEDTNVDMDQGVYLEQLHDTIMKAIKTLPERQQKIIYMSYFQNMQSDEIARVLNITPGNVRVLLSATTRGHPSQQANTYNQFLH